MAIKGKSKSRGAKSVARGPKPAYVPVTVPLLRRRGLWIAVVAVLGAAAVAGLAYGFVQQRNDDRERAQQQRTATVVGRYRGEIEPILASVGSVVPPSSFAAFPDLGTAIAALEADRVDQDALDQASGAAEATASSAENASGLLEAIDTSGLVSGKDLTRDFVLYILNSRDGFRRAMDLYRQSALLTSMAAEAEEGPDRDELVTRAGQIQDLAAEILGTAYGDYVEAQVEGGVFQPAAPGALTGPTG